MAGRTSASHARHDTRASSTAKHRRKRARTQKHGATGTRASLPKVESNAQAEYSGREPESDSTLDATSNDLGDIERGGDFDQDRQDSDIERAVEPDQDREDSDIERAH